MDETERLQNLSDKPESSEQPAYHDPAHPQLAKAATRLLRRALEKASENAHRVDDYWDVFRDFVVRHEYASFVDTLTTEAREEIRRLIRTEQGAELRKEALVALKADIRKSEWDDIYESVYEDLKSEIEDELRETLTTESAAKIRDELRAELRPNISAELKAELRSELQASAEFIAGVKADLQRKLLGL